MQIYNRHQHRTMEGLSPSPMFTPRWGVALRQIYPEIPMTSIWFADLISRYFPDAMNLQENFISPSAKMWSKPRVSSLAPCYEGMAKLIFASWSKMCYFLDTIQVNLQKYINNLTITHNNITQITHNNKYYQTTTHNNITIVWGFVNANLWRTVTWLAGLHVFMHQSMDFPALYKENKNTTQWNEVFCVI